MDIDTLEKILSTDPTILSVGESGHFVASTDQASRCAEEGLSTDQGLRSVEEGGHSGASSDMTSDGTIEAAIGAGWDISEWKDTAGQWTWVLDEDGWWKDPAEY
jgi:hypothetical protein